MSESTRSTFNLLVRAAERNAPVNARTHLDLWWSWLALPLRQQTEEIERAVSAAGEMEMFAITEVYRHATEGNLIPDSATPEERHLFIANFEVSFGLVLGAALSRQLGPDSATAKGWLQPRVA